MNISPAIQRTFSRSVLQLQKYSPQILTGIGIAGLVTAGVIAAKNTLKLEETLETANTRIEEVKEAVEVNVATQKDVNRIVIRNAVDLAKLYIFPVTLGGASIVAILVGHRILHQRNLAIVAAYKGLEQFIADYRKRVIEDQGEDADRKYAFGIQDVEETIDGKKVKRKELSDDDRSGYVYVFEPGNDNWAGRRIDNIFFLEKFQNIFNDILKARKHVFLNDVLRALGFEDSAQGAVTGWTYDKGAGDDYISFNIKTLDDHNGPILLEFNVDGMILDLI